MLNVFYGIGDMYDNLQDFIDVLDERLPEGFIPIGDDSGGNIICISTEGQYFGNIFFWNHEQESGTQDDMTNVYFIASSFTNFLNKLYDK